VLDVPFWSLEGRWEVLGGERLRQKLPNEEWSAANEFAGAGGADAIHGGVENIAPL